MRKKIINHFQGNYRAFYSKYLQKVKPVGGDEYQALCPFHNDTKPSFTFNNQTGAYYCHGCNKKGGIFHFYAKQHGLDTKRNFGKILKSIANDFGITWEEKEKGKIIAYYNYYDEKGNLAHQTVRKDPKNFAQRRPDLKHNGKWIWKLNGIKTYPYNLPNVLKAKQVLILEGEKDCDLANKMGFVATCNPMGAGSWKDEYSQWLKGKDILLIPDNDNEGQEHMTKVAMSLNGTTKSLKWIELSGLPSKGDLSDWVKTYNDNEAAAERLAIMIENADPYEPPKKLTHRDIILPVDDFIRLDIPAKKQIVIPWLSEQCIGLIYGTRGVGKTWFVMGLFESITKGKPFGPWEIGESVPCLYLDGEMATQDVQERFRGLDPNDNRKSPLYIYSDAHANACGLSRANLLHDSWREMIKGQLLEKQVKLWAVDNLASLAGGIDENKKIDWDPVNQWLLELRFAGIATLLLHHEGKSGGQRGTSAREDNIDVSLLLKHPPNYVAEDGAKFITKFRKQRVRTQDLPLLADTQFHLMIDERGQHTWTWGNVKKETKIEILKQFDEGATGQEIAENLGISKGYVSRIKKEAIRDGYLNKKNKLTQTEGFSLVYGDAD